MLRPPEEELLPLLKSTLHKDTRLLLRRGPVSNGGTAPYFILRIEIGFPCKRSFSSSGDRIMIYLIMTVQGSGELGFAVGAESSIPQGA